MRNSELTIKLIIFVVISVIVIGYGLFRSIDLLAGPTLKIISPQNGLTFKEPFIEISGQAKRIAILTLNDRRIFTDKTGSFKEPLLLADGYNIITLAARDKFGRTISKTLRLVYQAPSGQ